MRNFIFTLLLLTFFCQSFQRKSRFISSNPISPLVVTNLVDTDMTPWFADFEAKQCVTIADSSGKIVRNQADWLTISANLKGGIGTSLCGGIYSFSTTPIDPTLPSTITTHILEVSIVSMSVVYEWVWKDFCGELISLRTPVDPSKPDINNGISCHCPGGGDARFDVCSNPTWSLLDYADRSMNKSKPDLTLCHNVMSSGVTKGCLFEEETTNYFLKFYTDYIGQHIFKAKHKHYEEVILRVCINGTQNGINPCQIIQMDDLTQKNILLTADSVNYNMDLFLNSQVFQDHHLSDYTFMTNCSKLSQVECLHAVLNDRVNDIGMYDPEKLCSIRIGVTGPKYNMETLESIIRDSFQSDQCHNPAKGKINFPITMFKDVLGPETEFSSRWDPNLFAFDQTTGTLKAKNVGSLGLRIEIQQPDISDPVFFDNLVENLQVTQFKFSCLQSINQDGFPCVAEYGYIGEGNIILMSNTSKETVAIFKAEPTNRYSFHLPTIFTSRTSVTLCAYTSTSPISICAIASLKIEFNRENDIKNATNDGQGDSLGDNTGGVVTKSDGKLANWLLALIIIASVVAFVILAMIFGPFVYHLLKFISIKLMQLTKSIKPTMDKMTEKLKISPAKEEEKTDTLVTYRI